MKAKDILELFDSSVRKLKKVYGTEALYVSIVAPSKISENPDRHMAQCLNKMDWEKLILKTSLTIFTKEYLKIAEEYRLDDEVLKCCIANSACHEMAHYLELARTVTHIRNEFVHEDKEFAISYIGKCFEYSDINPHGQSWRDVMDEMGARHTPYYW